MAATAACNSSRVLPSNHSLSSLLITRANANGHISSLGRPISTFNSTLNLNSFRLEIANRTIETLKHVSRLSTVFCLADDNLETYPESGKSSAPADSQTEATINLKLPRRSLLGNRCWNFGQW